MDLTTCSAKEIASFLLKYRFAKDESKTAAFLLESVSTLSNGKSIESTKPFLHQNKGDMKDAKVDEQLGRELSHISKLELSCIIPRGKYELKFHENGVLLSRSFGNPNSKLKVVITRENIKHLILFPKPDDCRQRKKNVTQMAYFVLHKSIPLLKEGEGKDQKQKFFPHVCLHLNNANKALDEAGEIEIELKRWKDEFNLPLYQSNMLSESMYFKSDQTKFPFIDCIHGVNVGYLYPMKDGLLFFKPPLFISREDIVSIGCGRVGSNTSRYVNLHVICQDDTIGDKDGNDEDGDAHNQYTVEFTNILREELGPLNDYIQRLVNSTDDDKEQITDDSQNTNHDQNEEMKNLEYESEDNDEPPRKRRTPKRAAASQSMEATRYQLENGIGNNINDDEDDEDFENVTYDDASENEEERFPNKQDCVKDVETESDHTESDE